MPAEDISSHTRMPATPPSRQERQGDRDRTPAAGLHVAITGASSGIGAALARVYAGPTTTLSLLARDRDRLNGVRQDCMQAGADVQVASLDVRDVSAIALWFQSTHAKKPIDLLIINAGIFDGHRSDGRREGPEDASRLVATNLTAAITTAQIAVPPMRARGAGHIAFVSSLAALMPLPDAPTYSATKAGVLAYADALAQELDGSGVRVSVILPGHVDTPQTAVHDGPLTMLISAEKAAAMIKTGLQNRRRVIAFPRRANVLVRLAGFLPWRLRLLATRGERFRVRSPTQ